MKIAWITGTSRGLGKALAELFLDADWYVNGMSRTHTMQHEAYTPHNIDLSDYKAVESFQFSIPESATTLLFIHNAGILGEIAPLGKLSPSENIHAVYQVNLISAAQLCNAFLAAAGRNEPEKGIVLISSGAGRNPYDGWAPYCSSKAGLDMLARCITEEQKRNNRNVKVFSVAPGVIDTEMQQEIRDASIENFSYAERFRNLKIDNQLESPEACAKKLFRMWQYRQMFDDVCLDLRKLNLD